ncbi:MAG: DnaA/Hda family protein [Pseudomonadota bacterium]
MQHETPVKSLTFDSFIPCPGNMTATQMAILMAENGSLSSGEALLYLYGDRGVGKTHLLNAVANAAAKYDTVFADVKKLLKWCEEKWEKGERVDLAERLIDPDLLLLDNVDASSEHEQFQAGLFDLIENRLSAGLGVVAAARVPPSGLKVFHSEYENLLGGGRIVKLDWADRACQEVILRNLVGAGNAPDAVLGAILSKGIEDGHMLKDWAQGLRAQTQISRLLTQLGYSPASVRKTGTDRGAYLISQWRLELEGRTHVADVAYSLTSRSVVTRCWSPLEN